MTYSWDFIPAMEKMVGISINTRVRNQTIVCPACGKKKYAISTIGGHGHCWACEFKGDHIGYISKATGLSPYEVRKQLQKESTPISVTVQQKREELLNETRASDDAHDKAYRLLLSKWNLTEENKKDMYERCMIDPDTLFNKWMYRSIPERHDTFNVCKSLQHSGCKLDNVAGFYRAKKGEGDFTWNPNLTPGIVMPLRNHKNQIVSLQIRKNDRDRKRDNEGKLEEKCCYFTSAGRPSGAKSLAGVHYACDWHFDLDEKCFKPKFESGFVLTEGIMKADIIHYLLPNLPVISVPGVSARTHLSVELDRLMSWGVEVIRLAFDADYKTNPNVQQALDKTKTLIVEKGFTLKPVDWVSEVTVNNETYSLNGLDDYLAYTLKNILPKKKLK